MFPFFERETNEFDLVIEYLLPISVQMKCDRDFGNFETFRQFSDPVRPWIQRRVIWERNHKKIGVQSSAKEDTIGLFCIVEFPELPHIALGATLYKCPYCHTDVSLKARRWIWPRGAVPKNQFWFRCANERLHLELLCYFYGSFTVSNRGANTNGLGKSDESLKGETFTFASTKAGIISTYNWSERKWIWMDERRGITTFPESCHKDTVIKVI
jgi:hypothetical protein